jgi:integrating conjugative element protein (TIGR03757 family)
MLKRSALSLALPASILCASVAILLVGMESAIAADVHVYTDSAHPVVAAAHVPVIYLDEPKRIQAELSRGLPKDQETASQIVRQRLAGQRALFSRRMSTAYRGVLEAWALGVLKVPAIVVDGQFAVYGDANVAHALTLIEQFRRQRTR